jgi:plasmid replication initiation protein
MIEKEKNLELKKHVATIHSTNKLTLLQRKIANALLFNAYDDLLVKNEYEIHIATLCRLIGYDSNDHKTIKKALVNLLATVIEWNLVDGDKLEAQGVWNASSIIADASIDGPLCTYSYSNKMKKLLYRPELYGRLNMVVQAKFQSSYGLALYENCIRYQGIEQTPWFNILKFRKLMGVEDGKYKIFRDFKHRVIDKAVEEVNKYSAIFITPHYQKQKRQVIAIQFLIKSANTAVVKQMMNPASPLSEILKAKFALSQKQVITVMSQYSEQYIQEKIALIETSLSYEQGKITNLAKYLVCALQDDYQPKKSSRRAIADTYEEHVSRSQTKKLEQRQVEEYQRYQHKEILRLFYAQSEVIQSTLLIEFEKFLGKGIYKDIYLRDGIKNILIKDQLSIFIKQKKVKFLTKILSYAEFCQNQEVQCSM